MSTYLKRRHTIFLCLLPAIILFTSPEADAQEVQRPFDEAGTITTIDRELEAALGLFPEYGGFREARLYQVSDTSYVLEVVYRPNDETLRDRQSLTRTEVEQLRERVRQHLERRQPTPPLNQEGRTELLVTSTLLSLGFYGYAVPLAMDVDAGTQFGALYLLTSGAGFFVPFLLTRDRSVTEGQAKLFQYGGTRGIAHGALLGALTMGDDLSRQGFMSTALLTSLTEGIVGYRLADHDQMTQGTAETIGVGGDFGLGLGLGTAYLINDDNPGPRLISAPSLLGAAAGLYTGHRLSQSTVYTPGDARILRLMGSLGALWGLTVTDLTGTEHGRAFVGASMATSLMGLGLGRRMLRAKNFSGAAGTFTTLGTIGGMLTGLGIAYLAFEDMDDRAPFLTLGSLGGTGGFFLMYRTYADEAQTSQTGWQIQFNPGGLAAEWLSFPASLVTVKRSF